MIKKQKCIVFDLDGTIFEDFFKLDKKYILEIFNNNKIVDFIDSICRKINSTNLIKNTSRILDLRLFVYSLFVNKTFKEVEREYSDWYIREVTIAIEHSINTILKPLMERDYHIIILSNNMYIKKLNMPYDIVTAKSKLTELKKLSNIYNIKYFVGDNYVDDICNAHILKIPPIYLGNSPFVKNSKKLVTSAGTLKEVIYKIIQRENCN